jgi:ankyrin repeat protein
MQHRNIQAQPSDVSLKLLDASAKLDVLGVQSTIDNGADVNVANAQGKTPLILAADHDVSNDKTAIVNSLLSQPDIHVNAAATNGETALYDAALACDDVTVQSLLYAGADPFLEMRAPGPQHGWRAFEAALQGYVNRPSDRCSSVISALPSAPGPVLRAVWLRLAASNLPTITCVSV